MSRRGNAGLFFFVLLGVLPLTAGDAEMAGKENAPPRIEYGAGRELCRLAHAEIIESSGLACGRYNQGVFWTHNDSGDQPRVFAFNLAGEDLGVFQVTGAQARDWEDMASVRIGRKAYLLLADVGDNAEKRKQYVIYIVEEPEIKSRGNKKRRKSTKNKKNAAAKAARLRTAPAQALRFTYEDGKHNCESVAVDPTTGVIYLVSKLSGKECKVYELANPFLQSKAKKKKRERKRRRKKKGKAGHVAKAIATLNIPTTSGMDISPDGLRALVLTYGHAYEYTRAVDESWGEAFARPPRVIRLPRRKQGEAVGYGPDGKTIYLTSEIPKGQTGLCPFFEVPVAGTEK